MPPNTDAAIDGYLQNARFLMVALPFAAQKTAERGTLQPDSRVSYGSQPPTACRGVKSSSTLTQAAIALRVVVAGTMLGKARSHSPDTEDGFALW